MRVKLSLRNNADTSASESRDEDPLERTPGHSKEGQEGVLGFSYSIPIMGGLGSKTGYRMLGWADKKGEGYRRPQQFRP